MKAKISTYLLFLSIFLGWQEGYAQDSTQNPSISYDFSGRIGLTGRYFPKKALYAGQHKTYLSAYYRPEFSMQWGKKTENILKFEGFLRIDQHDAESTHYDIRELYWQTIIKDWELSVGLKKIFWGVTEANHLVDIINQSDGLEGVDIEEKLGQPMIHLSKYFNWGTLDVFGMTYHRPLLYPGAEGRPRPAGVLDYSKVTYESSHKRYQPELGIRWSHSFNLGNVGFDIGLSHFYGTSRAPLFRNTGNFLPEIFYERINQTGLELQAATGPVLWKLEAIRRVSKRKTITAFVVGQEYTISNIFNTGADLGFLTEYNFDDRGDELITGFDNDIYTGIRITGNDTNATEFLGGYTYDLSSKTQNYFIKFNRRLSDTWKVNIQATGFPKVSTNEFLYQLRNDDFIKASLIYYF